MNAAGIPVTVAGTTPGMAFSVDAKGRTILYWSTNRATAAASTLEARR